MVSSIEGASPPEMMNWMHADLKIKFENGFSSMIEKRPYGMPRAVFSDNKKDHFASPEWSPIN